MPARNSDPLDTYRAKRKADRTPEPFGTGASAGGDLFVVQHHAARRLHYDLRLEMDGVLRSWAVPKGPSPNPADKRFAVKVEDHPLEYANFEGHIPDGNYGAGAVIVWDRGRWVPLNDPEEGLAKGKLLFELRGYKLRGRWTLVKTRQGETDWLLIKERDGHASEAGTEDYPADSILSGLTVDALARRDDPGAPIVSELSALGATRRKVDPRKTRPMLATAGRAFSRSGWFFELKYDGYRLLGTGTESGALLLSRAGHDLTATFPEIAQAVAALPFEHVVIDGEAVVHDEQGLPSFARLQQRGRLSRHVDIARAAVRLPATLYVFDLLGFGAFDVRGLPLSERKRLLRKVLPSVGPLRYSEHIETEGETLYASAGGLGLEGIVAKRADSRYRAGRTRDWIKCAHARSDDFAVIGFTLPRGARTGVGALLLGQYEGGTLRYVGRAGSGLDARELKRYHAELEAAPERPAPEGAPTTQGYRWRDPVGVAEVRFKERTRDGLLRQPVFLRRRDDKNPRECVLPESRQEEIAPVEPERPDKSVHFTNLDKVFWPDDGYTKGDLIAYYTRIAEWMLPLLADRPLVLTRYPDGIEGKSFFQKDAPAFAPDWIRRVRMWSEHAEREVRYFVAEDAESLAYIANMGTIPIHVWSSRIASLERPDWCILDLDPKGAPFSDVVTIARAIRALCEDIRLPSFVKTSGSTGLHVLIPLGAAYTYEQSRTLGELIARVVVAELPDIATIARAVETREGKVYVDYLQNGHGKLLVAPFCVRPLPKAPVSMPLSWREVTPTLDIARFTIRNAVRRMAALRRYDWPELLSLRPNLAAALTRLGERLQR